MGSNVGCGSSVYRPAEQDEMANMGSRCMRLVSELKFHGPFLGVALTIFGAIYFLK